MTRRRFWSVLGGILGVVVPLAALGGTILVIYMMANMRARRGR